MMKYPDARSGSMILTSIFFTSLLMLVLLVQWRSQEALQTIMRMRITQAQQHYAVDALLSYGVKLCKECDEPLIEALKAQPVPLLLTFKNWPLGEGKSAQGIIEIAFKNGFHLTAYLKDQDKKLTSVSCNLEKQLENNKNVYIVCAWKRS